MKFWAESSVQKDGIIHFRFPDGLTLEGRVIDHAAPHKFVIQYWAGSRVTFDLKDDGMGGTDLSLTTTRKLKRRGWKPSEDGSPSYSPSKLRWTSEWTFGITIQEDLGPRLCGQLTSDPFLVEIWFVKSSGNEGYRDVPIIPFFPQEQSWCRDLPGPRSTYGDFQGIYQGIVLSSLA